MEKFGFIAGFIAKIKVLYSEAESVLKFNGGLCAPFRVCRAVRQGCALSGMLYALSLEPSSAKNAPIYKVWFYLVLMGMLFYLHTLMMSLF